MPEAEPEERSPTDSVGDFPPRLLHSPDGMADDRARGRVRFAPIPDRTPIGDGGDDKDQANDLNGRQALSEKEKEKELQLQVGKLEMMERDGEGERWTTIYFNYYLHNLEFLSPLCGVSYVGNLYTRTLSLTFVVYRLLNCLVISSGICLPTT